MTTSKLRILTCTAAAIFAMAGCEGFYGRDAAHSLAVQRRLEEVQSLDLERESRSDLITVEEGTEELAKRVVTTQPARKSIELSLAQARAFALENNLGLKVQLVSPSIAQQDVEAQEAKFEPSLVGSLAHTFSHVKGGSNSTATSFEPGIDLPLATGGDIDLSLPMDHTTAEGAADRYAAAASFSISQPLLRDAGIGVNTASIRIADLEKQIVDSQTKLEVIRTLAAAERAYWRLYAARRELEVARQQLDLAMKQVNQARRRVQAGAAPKIEITRAQSGLAERVERIIIAETLIRRRQRELKRIMNRDDLPVDGDTVIVPQTQPKPMGLELDAARLADLGLQERMELFELELALAIDEEVIMLRRNAVLPGLDLGLGYTVGGAGRTLGNAFDGLGSNSTSVFSATLTAVIPLGNQAAEADLRQARLRRLRRTIGVDQQEQLIRQDVYDALDQLRQNWQRILAARQGTIIAALTYEAEQNQFELGLRTSIEVLEAATALAEQQSREIQALAEYEISKVNIAVATGTLLGHDRVRWQPIGLAGKS